MTRLIVLSSLLLLAFTGMAIADVPEDQYATQYFGTVARFETSQPVPTEGDYGYWSDNMDERMYDSAFLAQHANTVRSKKGLPALGEELYLYVQTADLSADDSYVYTISFQWLTPDEVRAILSAVNNLSNILPGAKLSFDPLKQRYFDASTFSFDDPLVFNDYGVNLSFPLGTNAKAMLSSLRSAFRQRFGETTIVDSLFYSESIYTEDEGSRMLSFQVVVDPDPDYYGYGG